MLRIIPLKQNMTEVVLDSARVLVSYETPVAAEVHGNYYKTSEKWSQTTSRHINKWLERWGQDSATEKPQEFFRAIFRSCTSQVPD